MRRLKNITLVTLILISVLLFSRIWFGENFIAGIRENIVTRASQGEKPKVFTVEDAIKPAKIIVTGSGRRNVVLKSSDGYDALYSGMVNAIQKLRIDKDGFLETDETELKTALRSRSVFFDFGSAYDSSLIKTGGISLPGGAYRNIVFVPSNSFVMDSVVYIQNAANNKIYKLVADMGGQELEAIINNRTADGETGNSPFAFELGFDKARTNTDISQNVLLDSTTVISLTDNEVRDIVPAMQPELTAAAVDELLKIFRFNENITRRYVDKDDIIVFVDNTSTLKIYPSYLIEYTSDSSELLSDTEDLSPTAYTSNIYSIMNQVFKAFGINGVQAGIATDVTSGTFKGDATFAFDYYINGMPLIINGENHGVSVAFSGGKVKSYTQYLCDFRINDTTQSILPMINALDLLYARFEGEKEVKLRDVFIAYELNENLTSAQPVWCARTKDNIMIIN